MKRTLVESVVFEPGDIIEFEGSNKRYCILCRHGLVYPEYSVICCFANDKRDIHDMPAEVFESAKYIGHIDTMGELEEWLKK